MFDDVGFPKLLEYAPVEDNERIGRIEQVDDDDRYFTLSMSLAADLAKESMQRASFTLLAFDVEILM